MRNNKVSANVARGERVVNGLLLALIPYSTFSRKKLCIKIKHVSKHRVFQNTQYVDNKIYFKIQGNPWAIFKL